VIIGVSYLEQHGHQGAVSSQKALAASERSQEVTQKQTEEKAPTKPDERTDLHDSGKSQRERAAKREIGRDAQQQLAKSARLRPDLLAKVRAGELSVNRACIEGGQGTYAPTSHYPGVEQKVQQGTHAVPLVLGLELGKVSP
jgi:hypothetical protein